MMLGDKLSQCQPLNLPLSSRVLGQMTQKKMMTLIEEKENIIRKLNKKVQKLEEPLKRNNRNKGNLQKKDSQVEGQNEHLEMLRAQIQKSKHLEDIIEDMTERIKILLEQLSNDTFLIDNGKEIKMMLKKMEDSRNASMQMDLPLDSYQMSAEWVNNIDIFEGIIRSFRSKYTSLREINLYLTGENEALRKKGEKAKQKSINGQEMKQLKLELTEEKRENIKLRKMVEKIESQKNAIVNKIQASAIKEADIKTKTKEELLQESNELRYRVKDLEQEKDTILKQASKNKQQDLKKYQTFLQKIRIIKQKSAAEKN